MQLFSVKNLFYLGNYHQAIAEGETLENLSQEQELERNYYLYRCYLAIGNYQTVLDEIKENSPSSLLIIKLFASLLSDFDSKKADVLDTLDKWKKLNENQSDEMFKIIAAHIFCNCGDIDEALRIIHNAKSLEALALRVQLLLLIHRQDIALQELKNLQKIDDDATLTQLATAWINLEEGSEKIKNAKYIFHELSEKYGATHSLLNGKAVCEMKMGNFEEAEKLLIEALEKKPNDPTTFSNYVCCIQHLPKSDELIQRQINKMQHLDKSHFIISSYNRLSEEFDKLANEFKI
ncbi:coatomer subunit epsilon [Anaeramoeba ignava]|uniref:Coatomer subunit epsilon n=1 Tax=Anaeramoeba ignava TaxID=1746090 RepID=A0A9Q0LLB3_ANAIG|nr:coatomer subunit epsilon [Anaeramoeba ignava]